MQCDLQVSHPSSDMPQLWQRALAMLYLCQANLIVDKAAIYPENNFLPKIPPKRIEPEASVCGPKISEAYHSDDKKKFLPVLLTLPHLKICLVSMKNLNKFRTIFHLLCPKSGSTSINCSIPKEDYSVQYVRIDDAIKGTKHFWVGCFLAKTDIESAFRSVSVHPDDYEVLDMHWEGKYYYDKVLPFGLRSAPFLFNQLSDALEWILLNKCNISFVCHILDDFLLIEPPAILPPHNSLCQQSLTNMLSTFHTINIPKVEGKTQGPSQVIEFMAILLDTIKMKA